MIDDRLYWHRERENSRDIVGRRKERKRRDRLEIVLLLTLDGLSEIYILWCQKLQRIVPASQGWLFFRRRTPRTPFSHGRNTENPFAIIISWLQKVEIKPSRWCPMLRANVLKKADWQGENGNRTALQAEFLGTVESNHSFLFVPSQFRILPIHSLSYHKIWTN